MKLRLFVLAVFCFPTAPLFAAEASHTLKTVAGIPKGLSPKVEKTLHQTGHQVTGPDGVVCVIWLVKDLEVKAKFKPSQSVAYPFKSGQLLGAMQFPKGSVGLDFRGQEIASGMYTLRYGQQPEDGNHLGTSDIRDFCLALPAKHDQDPKLLGDEMRLSETSAKAAEATHPAIFLMSAPPKKPEKEAKLIHNEDEEQWILQLVGTGKVKDKSVPLVIRIVTVGLGE